LKLIPLDEKLVNLKKKELIKKLRVNGRDPIKVKKSIQNLMWKSVGVVRSKKDMEKVLKELSKYRKTPLKVGSSLKRNMNLIAALDVQNMFHACEMIIKSALFRKESRGAHYRSDYKTTLDKFKRNIICTPNKGKGFKISTRSIPKIPEEIKRILDKKKTPESHLLE